MLSLDPGPDLIVEINSFLLARSNSSSAELIESLRSKGYRVYELTKNGLSELTTQPESSVPCERVCVSAAGCVQHDANPHLMKSMNSRRLRIQLVNKPASPRTGIGRYAAELQRGLRNRESTSASLACASRYLEPP